MSEHVDQIVTTETGVADAGSFEVDLETAGADRVVVFVDDGAGGTPASYDLDIEVSYDNVTNPTYMPRNTITGSTATHAVYTDVAPFNWRFTLTNSSGGSSDYRVRVISIDED